MKVPQKITTLQESINLSAKFNSIGMPRVKLFDEKEVLEKAMVLFWKKGYNATSIQDLVNHLGINRASLYDTYGGKKTLFCKAFEQYRSESTASVRVFLANEPIIKEGFRKLFLWAIEESKADKDRKGCFVVNVTTELLPYDVETLKVIQGHKKTLEGIFLDYLKLGVEKGQISTQKDLKSIASLIFTMQNGLRVITKVSINKKELLNSVDTLLSVLDN